jgi:DNA polymerase II small subunit/DNA polymerase delta subunit B
VFLSDDIPILINLPSSQEYVDIYFIHDIHYGSELFNEKKWIALKEMILTIKTHSFVSLEI